jgi:CRISPR-associated protein (TIGR03984 family)
VLHSYDAGQLTLADALAPLAAHHRGGAGAVALLYSPTRCQLARLEGDGQLTGPGPAVGPIDLGGVFEARVFGPAWELRWLNDATAAAATGAAVLLVEAPAGQPPPAPPPPYQPGEQVAAVAVLDRHYLLWGEGILPQATRAPLPPLATGWSWLATARIGAFPVPLAGLGPNDRAVLRAREYLAVLDARHGNVGVAEERLLGLDLAPPEPAATTGAAASAAPEG